REDLGREERQAEHQPQPPRHCASLLARYRVLKQAYYVRRNTRSSRTSPVIQKTCAPTAAAGTSRSSRPASAKASGKTCQSRVVRGESTPSRRRFSQADTRQRRASLASLQLIIANAPSTPSRSTARSGQPGALPACATRAAMPARTATCTTVSPVTSSRWPKRDSAK